MLKESAPRISCPPFYRARVDTGRPGYMIPIRLSWLHRARPSATLHEIQGLLKNEQTWRWILRAGEKFVKSGNYRIEGRTRWDWWQPDEIAGS